MANQYAMHHTVKKDHPFLDTKWMVYAACANAEDPDIFYPNTKNKTNTFRRRVFTEAFEKYCSRCPVRKACEKYSEEMSAGWGIWGEYFYDKSDRRNSA